MKSGIKYSIFIIAILQLFVILFLHSCANIKPPTGGPKDSQPPKLLLTNPPNGVTNYKNSKFTLYFDEVIQQQNLKQELLITPYKKNRKFKIKIKKNKAIITMLDTLDNNTTYLMDFQNGIGDITEKNIAKDVLLSFSTGPEIDSIEITGKIEHLLTGEENENVIVGLFDANDTLDIEESAPLYLTKTNQRGLYILENIKAGTYKVYALNDANKNFKYDQREEEIGFFSDSLVINENMYHLNLPIIDYDNQNLKYLKAQKNKKDLLLAFNKTVVDYRIEILDDNFKDSIFHQITSEDGIDLIYTGKNIMTDSIPISIFAKDSINQVIDTTTNIIFEREEEKAKTERQKRREEKKREKEKKEQQSSPFNFEMISPTEKKLIPTSENLVELKFEKPIATYIPDSIFFIQGEDTTALNPDIKLNFNKTITTLGTYKADSAFAIMMKKGTFVSIQNDSSTQQTLSFSIKSEDEYGIIEGAVKGEATNFFVQLLNDKYDVVQEVKNQKEFRFEYLKPGAYYLRALIDENGDGIWSKGDFRKRIPPERVVLFKKKLSVEANWEIRKEDATIDINEK